MPKHLTTTDVGSSVQAYDAQLASLAALAYGGNGGKFVRVNAGETAFELATVSSGPGGEAFPVGAVYINYTGTDPATELGYGSWQLMGTKEFSSI